MAAPAPNVIVYSGTDDQTRGDVHGAVGVGQSIARKINGVFRLVGDADLARLYPQEKPADALAHYFRDNGKPDVLLSKFWRVFEKALGKKDQPLVLFDDNNEYMTQKYLNEKSLVTHHVTPELLAAEGKKFRETYPGLPAPLIAVLLARLSDIDGFAAKLVSKAAATPEAAIFVTSIWRTPEEQYNNLMEALKREAEKQGAAGRIKIIGVPFTKKEEGKAAPYNPYLGLLDAADHVIVTGHSLSMMTEPMAAGKLATLFEPGATHDSLEQKGLVRDFNKAAAKTPFDSSKITPFNPTEAIAEKMAAEYRKKDFWRKLKPSNLLKKALGR